MQKQKARGEQVRPPPAAAAAAAAATDYDAANDFNRNR